MNAVRPIFRAIIMGYNPIGGFPDIYSIFPITPAGISRDSCIIARTMHAFPFILKTTVVIDNANIPTHYINLDIDHKLEILNLWGSISQQNYSQFMGLKAKRNKLIHSLELPEEEDAKTCLNLGFEIIKQVINAPSTIHPPYSYEMNDVKSSPRIAI